MPPLTARTNIADSGLVVQDDAAQNRMKAAD
jgi:hypothetical protein